MLTSSLYRISTQTRLQHSKPVTNTTFCNTQKYTRETRHLRTFRIQITSQEKHKQIQTQKLKLFIRHPETRWTPMELLGASPGLMTTHTSPQRDAPHTHKHLQGSIVLQTQSTQRTFTECGISVGRNRLSEYSHIYHCNDIILLPTSFKLIINLLEQFN